MYLTDMPTEPEQRADLKLARPPVQQVTLSVFSAPRWDLMTHEILAIIKRWGDYPKLDEFPRTSSWRTFTEDESFARFDSERRSLSPNFVLSSAAGDRSIRVQQDRFELVWRFSAESSESRYPGYARLREELSTRLNEYTTQVREVAGGEIDIQRADVTYENLIDLPVREFCLGIVSGWQSVQVADICPSSYSGMRFGGFEDLGDDRTYSSVAIDPGPDELGTNFIIDVQCDVASSAEFFHRLDLAHSTAISLFSSLTSDQMRHEWGQL